MNKINESIALIGGGSGVYQVARFLKHARPNISTIQTMFDHGGDSGKIRDETGILPPGDIRRAILALSNDELHHCYRTLLTFRSWPESSRLNGTCLGNSVLTAFTLAYGSLITGIECMSKVCHVQGKVLPVTLDDADLCARLSDGHVICGENLIDTRSPKDDRTISSVFLDSPVSLYAGAHDAILDADKIVFCPGDLYTSVIPSALVEGFTDAIRSTKARLVYVVNIMTKKSETPGFTSSQFAKTLLDYIKRDRFDVVICNSGIINERHIKAYRKERSEPVQLDTHKLKKFTKQIVAENVTDQSSDLVRHSRKTASIIAQL